MSQQTSYTVNHTKGFAGQLADCAPREVETKLNEESTAGAVKFGMGVRYGTADNQVLLPDTAGQTIIGFVVMTNNFEMPVGGDEVAIAENDTLSIIRDGSIYVVPEDDVTQGGAVYVRHTTNTTELPGAVRSDIDTDKAILTTWEFAESGTAGTPVKIRKA